MVNCVAAESILGGFPHAILYSVVILVYSPIIVIINLALIISFIATKQATKNTSNFLIMCLSFSDLVQGTVILPMFAYILFNGDSNDICTTTKVLLILGGAFGNFSAILTVLVAIDRYLHMNPKIQVKSSLITTVFKVSNIGYLVMTVFIVVVSFAILSTMLLASRSLIMAFIGIFSVAGISIYISTTTCLYISGYRRIRSFTDQNPVYQETGASGEQPKYVKNLHKTVLILVLEVFATYLPYSIAQGIVLALQVGKVPYNTTAFAYCIEISGMLMHSNHFVNGLVVLYFNDKARAWIFHKCMRRRITTEPQARLRCS